MILALALSLILVCVVSAYLFCGIALSARIRDTSDIYEAADVRRCPPSVADGKGAGRCSRLRRERGPPGAPPVA